MPARPIPAPEPPPPQRLPEWPLPPYRFVPGLNPHPFRNPAGHAYTDGSPPQEAPWDPHCRWQEDRDWLRGLDLFDHRYWWEAHEVWEAIWHQVARGSPTRELIQGLIQAAAALLKSHLGQTKASERLLARATVRLERVLSEAPTKTRGLDLPVVLADLHLAVARGTYPPPLCGVEPTVRPERSDPGCRFP
jgi:hypothetical protein